MEDVKRPSFSFFPPFSPSKPTIILFIPFSVLFHSFIFFMTRNMLTLHSHGDRLVPITTIIAEELVAQWQEQLVPDLPIILDLSCRVWRKDCLDVLQQFLQSIKSRIHTLKIDDIIAGLLTEDGLASLAFFNDVFSNSTRLQVLHLDDNALGIRGVELLRDLLQLPHTLTLENTGLSRESLLVLQVRPDLQAIRLGRNQIGPQGAEVVGTRLPQWQHLQILQYNGCRPLEQGTKAICQGLAENTRGNPNLGDINVMDSELKSGDDPEHPIHDLCAAISQSPHLQTLNVVDCSLQPDGLELLLTALTESRAPLTSLKVSGNELEAAGMEHLTEYLLQQDTLECLEIATNEIEQEGLEHLLPYLQQTTSLRELNLSENCLESDAVQLLLQHKIVNLETLIITETEMTRKQAQQLRAMYATVVVDEEDLLEDDDDDDAEEKDDQDIDDLAAQMEKAAL
jgi:Ran GTPase-activating protein (RanGAP) involved in mRNA processing and transport